VDGLQSEREQGITIDVAYRYFSTDKRKFIIADTPGHEQYTRNMATGASTASLAVILIDARHGVQTQTRHLLRFITCGSVDDGKSTLIGRLLHDSKMIYEDQLAAITQASKISGTTGDQVDLALLVDGLQSEREQGITIDVAYRYFSTDLLGIQHLVIAVNKMDLVDYSQARFDEIVAEYRDFAAKLNAPDIHFVPLSALEGDNVVNKSEAMSWYEGPALLHLLETVEVTHDKNLTDLRLPVQYVNRPHLDFRGYCGTLEAGILRPGQRVKVLPSGKASTVARIVTFDGDLEEA
ncbi:GTP-binding protein, partial [Chromohalobacter israelensis]|uniref:GTP-binding protein n=1 Tax=Chromohalobacter israelensis TaxID=141390 RepID=UPI003AF56418